VKSIINSKLLVKSVSLWSEDPSITLRKIEPMSNNEKAERGGPAVRHQAERDGDIGETKTSMLSYTLGYGLLKYETEVMRHSFNIADG
jgi:hypothetical protein